MKKAITIPDRFEKVNKIISWDNEQFEHEAEIAIQFVQHWGMVAGIPDGEDSAGRYKIRLQTPEELVERATTTASLLMATIRKKGLVYVGPELTHYQEPGKEEKGKTVTNEI